MSLGLVGRKVGMTRIFAEDGASIPVTVLDVSNNRVTQVKTPEVDGYAAVQVAFGQRRASRVSKPLAGHLAKAGVEAGHVLKEFPVTAEQLANFKAGDQVAVTIFAEGQRLTSLVPRSVRVSRAVSSVTTSLPTVHPTVTRCRTMRRVPSVWRRIRGRVFPGKRMAGHLGDEQSTTQGLTIVRVDAERQLLLVKGAVPGAKGSDVVVRPAVKA